MNCKMAGLMGAAADGAAGHVAEKKMKEKSEDTGLLGMGQAVGYYNMLYQWTHNDPQFWCHCVCFYKAIF